MNFRLTKRKRGFKEWKLGRYRITFYQTPGEPKRYYATVKAYRFDGEKYWEFVTKRRPYKTFKKAVAECELHEKLWLALEALNDVTGHRQGRVDALVARERFTFTAIPIKSKVSPKLLRMLPSCVIPNRPAPIATSATSVSPTATASPSETTADSGPASASVEAAAPIENSKTLTRSKGTSSRRGTSAKTAEAPDAGRKQSAKSRTERSSKPGKKSTKRGKSAKRTAKAA